MTLDDAIDLERLVQRALDGIDLETFTLGAGGRDLLRRAKVSAEHRKDAERVARALGLRLEEM